MDGRDGSGGNRVAVNVLGTMGAVFWSIQLLPQLYINWRKRDTTGLQPSMMLLWAFAGLPLGVHNILADENVALQAQAQILTLLSLLTWSQVMFYGHKWSLSKSTIVVLLLALAFGAFEAAIVCVIKYGTKEQVPKWTLDLFASLAAAGLGMGVLRHYYDIYIYRSVRGISFFFVGLDAAGDLTSLISVVLDRPISAAAVAIYGTELLLWIGVMLAGIVFNLRHWIGGKGDQLPATIRSPTAMDGEQGEIDAAEGQGVEVEDVIAERTAGEASSNSSRASSVFHTPTRQSTKLLHRVRAAGSELCRLGNLTRSNWN